MLIRSCLLALVGASAWLSGCASLDDLEHRTRQARSEMTQTLASPSNAFQQPGLVRHERPLIGLTEVPVAPKPLPEQFDKDVSFASFGSQGLPEILDALSRMTGISIEAREVFA
ncbi:MAG: hypothetical protein NZ553_00380, partial [Caldilinea sp.]|nr:hypothetical protein [Caldilinea sp.]MDW8438904.1 hypothetical protein [Caldilineaceae bacterium]